MSVCWLLGWFGDDGICGCGCGVFVLFVGLLWLGGECCSDWWFV